MTLYILFFSIEVLEERQRVGKHPTTPIPRSATLISWSYTNEIRLEQEIHLLLPLDADIPLTQPRGLRPQHLH